MCTEDISFAYTKSYLLCQPRMYAEHTYSAYTEGIASVYGEDTYLAYTEEMSSVYTKLISSPATAGEISFCIYTEEVPCL